MSYCEKAQDQNYEQVIEFGLKVVQDFFSGGSTNSLGQDQMDWGKDILGGMDKIKDSDSW